MPNKKISQLTTATIPLTGTEQVPVVQGGQTLKTTTQDIANLAGGGGGVKKYVALLTQVGFEEPNISINVTVLENNIGNITWIRESAGVYKGTLSNAFPLNKTWLSLTHDGWQGSTGYSSAMRNSNNELYLTFNTPDYYDFGDGAVACIEIRVYP